MFPRTRINTKTIAHMVDDDVFYITVGVLVVDASRRAWLEKDGLVFSSFDTTTPVKVSRIDGHFIVDISATHYNWTPTTITARNLYEEVSEIVDGQNND